MRRVRYVAIVVPDSVVALIVSRRQVAPPTYWQEGKPREAVARGYDALDAPYFMDRVAKEFVKAHPDGASLYHVAVALQIGKSTAQEIEQRAFRKLLEQAEYGNFGVRRWLTTLGERAGVQSVEEAYDDDDC
jgi:hypothetical protein